jgi:hypothetical protein
VSSLVNELLTKIIKVNIARRIKEFKKGRSHEEDEASSLEFLDLGSGRRRRQQRRWRLSYSPFLECGAPAR